MIPRPPIIAILGHIDHGKSTLLDYIRKTNIVEKESGGITQNTGAYEVLWEGKKMTFLDTPGHEAFGKLRSQGAQVADIGLLIISAEDGVKTQTKEALKTILEAKLPYIVVITKIDKPEANIERVKQNLLENEIYIEGYGGSIPCIGVSAKTGEGIPELLDMITLVAEMEELSAEINTLATGIVIETNRDKQKGISATLLIKNGTLELGQFVKASHALSPVRIFQDFQGNSIKEATVSSPVRIVGWSDVPVVGSIFSTFKTKKEAELAVETEAPLKTNPHTESITPNIFYIPILIKAQTSGVIEAIIHEIKKLETETVKALIIHTGIGDISESDVKLASGGNNLENTTIIVGFGNKVDSLARAQGEKFNIKIQTFDIIYKLSEFIRDIFVERTPKVQTEEKKGTIKVLKIFSTTKDKQILGGRVENGSIGLGDEVKILRRDTEIGTGRVRELQQGKVKTSEVLAGLEFGSMIESKIDIAPGDQLIPFAFVTK